MTCEKTRTGAVFCWSGEPEPPPPCSECGEPAEYECDGPTNVIEHPSHYLGRTFAKAVRLIPSLMFERTCDKPLCEKCRTVVDDDTDFCPACVLEYAPWLQPVRDETNESEHDSEADD